MENSRHYRIASRLQGKQSNLYFASCLPCLAANYARARASYARARALHSWLVSTYTSFFMHSLLSSACGNRILHLCQELQQAAPGIQTPLVG